MLKKLRQKDHMRGKKEDSLEGAFDGENIASNLRRLDQLYAQKLSPEELDGRHFI